MATLRFDDSDALSVDAELRIDEVCLRFEAAWKSGDRPSIEPFLKDVAETERLALVRELIRLDVFYRRSANEVPHPDEYLRRFPEIDATWAAEQFVAVEDAGETPIHRTTDDRNSFVPSNGQFAEYDRLEFLGRGGMGVVYKARQIRLNRSVALKMIRSGDEAAPAERQRFRIEAEAVARISHPNIVQIYEVGEHQGRPFLSLEFVEGGSLHAKLQGTPLPPRTAARLTELLARAIQVAHEQGVLHRDLKPANVFLSPAADESGIPIVEKDGRENHYVPKIGDFGLAKKLDEPSTASVTAEAGLTQAGAIVGTPSYMAPEQARGQLKEIGPATDVYALGAILYELLTGHPPFKAATMLETVLQSLHNEPVPVRHLQSKTPRDLETICLKCLQKNPHKRYTSASALADDLRRFQNGEPVLARPVSAIARGWRWCRRHPALAGSSALIVGLLLVVAIGSVWFGVQQEKSAHKLKAALDESNLLSARFALEKGQRLAERGHGDGSPDAETGILWMAHALSLAPESDKDLQWAIRLNLALWSRELFLERAEWSCKQVAVPARGSLFVTASGSTARIWNIETFLPVGKPMMHKTAIGAVACDAEGTRVLTGSEDGKAIVWNLATGEPIGSVLEHPSAVKVVALSPDGMSAATACQDGSFHLWDLATGKKWAEAPKQETAIITILWSRDGQRLLTVLGDEARHLQFWDANTGKPLGSRHDFGAFDKAFGVALSPDNKSVLIGRTFDFGLFESPSVNPIRGFGPTDFTGSVNFNSDGQMALAACGHRSVRLLDLKGGQLIGNPIRHAANVSKVLFVPNDQQVVTLSGTTAGLWQIPHQSVKWFRRPGKENPLLPLQPGDNSSSLSVRGDGQVFVAAGRTKKVRQQSARDGKPFGPWFAQDGVILSAALSDDGRFLLTGGADNTARLWNTETGETVGLPLVHETPIVSVAISPNNQILLTASLSDIQRKLKGRVRVWDAETGKLRAGNNGPEGHCVAFSKDGRYNAFGRFGLARVRETEPESPALPQLRNGRWVRGLVFSPDNRFLFAANEDRVIECWDFVRGVPVGDPMAHPNWVTAIALSPDGRILASACGDGVRLWDAGTHKQLGPVLPLPYPGTTVGGYREGGLSVQFAEGGRTLLICGSNQNVLRWELPDPVAGSASRIACWAELMTSRTLDREGIPHQLPPDQRDERRQRFRELGGDMRDEPPQAIRLAVEEKTDGK